MTKKEAEAKLAAAKAYYFKCHEHSLKLVDKLGPNPHPKTLAAAMKASDKTNEAIQAMNAAYAALEEAQ